MSAPAARLTIDGRELEAPAGSGLVEAAATLGIEVPVFCYEPRIGPAVGACRMCLVEIEGMPKLQTACSTPVRDGMVVSTVSDRARVAQEGVLEFLLVNHPLDCPVCDKGGECPLQDQAFRWGPGASRFLELKRNSDKPIPISPLIALDRERCILCYRCTRFSDEVSQDLQLVARERGADSVIATFEGRPYAGHFSGNVIELCPVGALTSTAFRFKGRPWETPDHPTVCGLCPVGCNTYASVREGAVARVLARENPAVDDGWLCDRGRFSYTSLYSAERKVSAQLRGNRERPPGNRPVADASMEVGLEWLHARLAEAGTPEPGQVLDDGDEPVLVRGALWVLSGYETLEEAWAIQQLAAVSGGRVVAVDGAAAALPQHSATLDDVVRARHFLLVGDADLAEVAPIVDLRVRKALRAGASAITVGIGGTRLEAAAALLTPCAPGDLEQIVRAECERIASMVGPDGSLTEGGIVIYRDGELSQPSLDLLAATFQFPRAGSGFLAIPAAPNARGLAALGIEPVGFDALRAHVAGESRGGIVFCGVDPARHYDDDQWRPLVRDARWVATVALYDSPLHEVADLALPATSAWEKDGTLANLEGRLQRLTVGARPPAGLRGELSWLAGLARRMGADVPGNAASAYRMLVQAGAAQLPAATHGDIPAHGVLGVRGGPAPRALVTPGAAASTRAAASSAPTSVAGAPSPHAATAGSALTGDGIALTVFVAPFLYDAPDVAAAERMEFLRDTAYITLARADAAKAGVSRGDRVRVDIGGRIVEATVAESKRITAGNARMFAGAPGMPPGRHGYDVATVSPLAVRVEAVVGG